MPSSSRVALRVVVRVFLSVFHDFPVLAQLSTVERAATPWRAGPRREAWSVGLTRSFYFTPCHQLLVTGGAGYIGSIVARSYSRPATR